MTIIQLIGDVQNEGINDYLELSQDVAVPLNFGVSDIRDLSKKKGTFSKSIKVVGTKHNNEVLNHYYNVNVESFGDAFDINRVQKCLIIQDGVVVLDNAVMQLIDVEVSSKSTADIKEVVYTVLVKDTVADLFTNIGNLDIKDLNFSDLNHTYNAANVIASFDHDVTDGYKYVLPMTSNNSYLLQEMKPAVYAKVVMDRIFERAGKAYQWDDFEDVGFDKLLLPYSGDKATISDATIEDARVIADNDTPQDITQLYIITPFLNLPAVYEEVIVDNEIKDNNNYYNPATSIFTSPFNINAPDSLVYNIDVEWEIVLVNNEAVTVGINPTATGLESTKQSYRPNFFVTGNGSGVGQIKGQGIGQINTVSAITYNSNNSVVYDLDFVNYAPLAVGDNVIASGTDTLEIPTTNIAVNDTLYTSAGLEYFSFLSGFIRTTDSAPANVDEILRIKSIKINIAPSAEALGFGFPIVMNAYTPLKMKQSAFVKSIFTMFNLFPVQDEANPNLIHLITRDDYYDSGATNDWSEKKSKDRTQTITFLPDITSKKMIFTYKEDKDPMNQGYLSNVGEIYGQTEFTFDNEYVKNEDIKEVEFGASPYVRTDFGALVHAVNGSEPKTLPRIVYDGGKYPCGGYTITDYGTVQTTVNEYPFCTHFDKPVNPSKDFNWGQCRYYFDDGYQIAPYNNLTNTYWRRTLGQINSGKLFTAYFDLTTKDIAELKLNDKIFVDGLYWYINKVIDYNANAYDLTKVELLSADTDVKLPRFSIPFVKPDDPVADPPPIVPVGGIINGISTPVLEVMSIRQKSLNLDLSQEGSIIKGKSNFILPTVKSAIVIGDGKTIENDGIFVDNIQLRGANLVGDDDLFMAWFQYNSGTSELTTKVLHNSMGDFTIDTLPPFGAVGINFINNFVGKFPVISIHTESATEDPRIFWATNGDFYIDNILLGDINKMTVSIKMMGVVEVITTP